MRMASCERVTCDHCAHTIDVWSDGNPYYIDEDGKKRYAYHPNHELLARCIGNDEPHLCLACGARTKVDSRAPRDRCRKCRARALVSTDDVAGRQCPYCRQGVFQVDPSFFATS